MIIGINGKQLKTKKSKLEQDRDKLYSISRRFGVREKHLEEFLQTFMKQLVELKEENYKISAEELNRVIEDVKK
jgi:hypothetical protein